MKKSYLIKFLILSCFSLFGFNAIAQNEQNAPWGGATTLDIKYAPQKVLFDLTTDDPKHLGFLLDRVNYLFTVYESDLFESSIIVIVHGESIPFFAIDKYAENVELMERASSLTVGTTIEFRMCKVAAKMAGYEPKNIHGFVKMVPMADAEIIRLQQEEGYAYMQ